jgi:hypothetical protein
LFEYQHLLWPRDILWSKFWSMFKSCSFLTPVLIRHLWQLKTVVFLQRCLICSVQLLGMFSVTFLQMPTLKRETKEENFDSNDAMEQHIFAFWLIIEGTTEKELQFIMQFTTKTLVSSNKKCIFEHHRVVQTRKSL